MAWSDFPPSILNGGSSFSQFSSNDWKDATIWLKENTAEDADGFYLHKFPHKGSGKVEPPLEEEWPKYISPDLAQTIRGRFTDYCQYFGYLS